MGNEHDQVQQAFEAVWPGIEDAGYSTDKDLATISFCAGWIQRGKHNIWTEEQRQAHRAAKCL